MEFVHIQDKAKNLIVFVHGLNGSDETWRGSDKGFVENCLQVDSIRDNFDMALFIYRTKIIEIPLFSRMVNMIRGLFSKRPKEDIKGFNKGIKEIADVFRSDLSVEQEKYETITFIAHSMGGLVTKKTLTIISEEMRAKCYLFISLSVPHIGSRLANIGDKLIGKNPQIADLRLIGDFTTELNEHYSDLTSKPKIIYQSGNYDDIVNRQSAIPPNVPRNNTFTTNDEHFSVTLINDRKTNSLFKRIISELEIVLLPTIHQDVEIPLGTRFKFLLLTVASRIGISIDFEGFTENELETPLRNAKVSSLNLKTFIVEIGSLGLNRLPEYIVEQEVGTLNFVIKVV